MCTRCAAVSVIDMRQMNRVLRVSVEDMDATVEAGISRMQLVKALENTGLTFFIDPGADATLGGMASTRASGTTAVRYGTMRENVLGLTVVLADGRVIHTGTRARKSSAGYDLTRLFVGAEGTLGVITEVTLRLHGLPEAMGVATCAFATIDGAVKTVIEVIQLGLGVARIEFMDDASWMPSIAIRVSNCRCAHAAVRVSRHQRRRSSPRRRALPSSSPRNTAAWGSRGKQRSPAASVYGRHATMCTMPRARFGPAPRC